MRHFREPYQTNNNNECSTINVSNTRHLERVHYTIIKNSILYLWRCNHGCSNDFSPTSKRNLKTFTQLHTYDIMISDFNCFMFKRPEKIRHMIVLLSFFSMKNWMKLLYLERPSLVSYEHFVLMLFSYTSKILHICCELRLKKDWLIDTNFWLIAKSEAMYIPLKRGTIFFMKIRNMFGFHYILGRIWPRNYFLSQSKQSNTDQVMI